MENSPFYPTNYEMQKNAVLELFERYKTLRGAFNDGVDLIFLERKVEVLRKNKYLIAVVGQAKSGKSKFINALLGKEIVPTDVKQCTSGIIEIVESKTISLRVKFANGKEEYHEYDDVNTLNRQLRNIASVQEKYRKIPFIKINDLLIQGEFKNGIIKPELLSDTENSGNEYKLPLNEYYGLIKAYAEEYKELDRIPKEISVGHPLGYEC